MTKILYVYKWATMGGVERVLINRALAFKKQNKSVYQEVFFYFDSGGKEMLSKAIKDYEIEQYLKIVEVIDNSKYDYVHSIDTPEILQESVAFEKLIFECHTSYKENRGYLKTLPDNLKGIVVPSETFKSEIMNEIPLGLKKKVYVIGNCLPRIEIQEFHKKIFSKVPITYIGRVDKLKNVEEIIEIFKVLLDEIGDKFLLFVAGPIMKEVDLFHLIEKKKLRDRFIYLPSIPFEKMETLLSMIKHNKGIVISASKGESFGLSIAEAINMNIPIIASKQHAHLVNNNEKYLYELGDIQEAVKKINYIYSSGDNLENELEEFKNNFSEERLVIEWDKIY